MPTELADPIQYYMVFDDGFLNVNQVLNKKMHLHLEGYPILYQAQK